MVVVNGKEGVVLDCTIEGGLPISYLYCVRINAAYRTSRLGWEYYEHKVHIILLG